MSDVQAVLAAVSACLLLALLFAFIIATARERPYRHDHTYRPMETGAAEINHPTEDEDDEHYRRG